MHPEPSQQPLAQQPWFMNYLAAKGFIKSSPTTFVREKTSIHLDGAKIHADPGNGQKT